MCPYAFFFVSLPRVFSSSSSSSFYFHIHSNFSAVSPFFCVCEKLLQCACMNIKSYSAYLVRIAALALLIRLTLTLSTLSFLVSNPPSFLSLTQSLTLYTSQYQFDFFSFFFFFCALACLQIRYMYFTFHFAKFYFMRTTSLTACLFCHMTLYGRFDHYYFR